MRGSKGAFALAAALSCAGCLAESEPGPPTVVAPIDFFRDIRPVLSNNCFPCHGPDADARQGALRLDLEDAVFADPAGRTIVARGDPSGSLLYQRVIEASDRRMPPVTSGRALDPDEIDKLRAWIEQGAPWKDHWAFDAPTPVTPPSVGSPEWVQNGIDAFVLARLEEQSLTPSGPATKEALIRRASLDLTGLPPTLPEIDAFLADGSDEAWARVVDRLLASPRYAEHMARDWMDAARYADTHGFHLDQEREMWAWRDWVISAFDRNLPFDQFTIHQIAGDLMPEATDQSRLATGFNRNHPITHEMGVIEEEYIGIYVSDRVNTLSTVWLGLTLGCARCHDHKYDPFSQRDYYQLFACFNGLAETGDGYLSRFGPKAQIPSPYIQRQLDDIDRQIEQIDGALEAARPQARAWETGAVAQLPAAFQNAAPEDVRSQAGPAPEPRPDGSLVATGPAPDRDAYTFVISNVPAGAFVLRIEALTDPSLPAGGPGRSANGNFVLSEIEAYRQVDNQRVEWAAAYADVNQIGFEADSAIDRDPLSGWAVATAAGVSPAVAVFVASAPFDADTLIVRMTFNHGGAHILGRFRASVSAHPLSSMRPGLDVVLATDRSLRRSQDDRELREYFFRHHGPTDLRAQMEQLLELRDAWATTTEAVPHTYIMQDMSNPRPTHVLARGQYDQHGEEVECDVPSVFPGIPDGLPKNRYGLARWLVMPHHPLTSRVIVNRLWRNIFGSGLVSSVEDFGAQGELPSHPELLDWLAMELVDTGWDLKAMLRMILMSSTYRQSSATSAQLLQADPNNRSYARGPRVRLTAETIRDQALFVSGLLVERMGGPSVYPYQPAGLWLEQNNKEGFAIEYPRRTGEELYRRSLYTFWKRTLPPPSLAIFDAPNRELSTVRRDRSNTPLQAMVLMNDPQFVEASRHLAERMLGAPGADLDAALEHGFRLVTARLPDPEELAILRETHAEQREIFVADPALASRLVNTGDSPRNEALDAVDHAAMTQVARLLFNLSETITKE